MGGGRLSEIEIVRRSNKNPNQEGSNVGREHRTDTDLEKDESGANLCKAVLTRRNPLNKIAFSSPLGAEGSYWYQKDLTRTLLGLNPAF